MLWKVQFRFFQKWVAVELPDATLVFKYDIYTPFISMVVMTTKTPIYITDNFIPGMLNIFTFCQFFLVGGGSPPPPDNYMICQSVERHSLGRPRRKPVL